MSKQITLKSNRIKMAVPSFISYKWKPSWANKDKTVGIGYFYLQAWKFEFPKPRERNSIQKIEFTNTDNFQVFQKLYPGQRIRGTVSTSVSGNDSIEFSYYVRTKNRFGEIKFDDIGATYINYSGEVSYMNETAYPVYIYIIVKSLTNNNNSYLEWNFFKDENTPAATYNLFEVESPYENFISKETLISSWDLVRYPSVKTHISIGETTGDIKGTYVTDLFSNTSKFGVLPFNFSGGESLFKKTDVVMTYDTTSSDGTGDNFLNKSGFGVIVDTSKIPAVSTSNAALGISGTSSGAYTGPPPSQSGTSSQNTSSQSSSY